MQRLARVLLAIVGGAILSGLVVSAIMPPLVGALRDRAELGCWTTSAGPTMCSDGSIFGPTAFLLFVVTWISITVALLALTASTGDGEGPST